MRSDQVIGNREVFPKAIEIGVRNAQNRAILTFGAQPTGPNTEYRYIEANIASGPAGVAFPTARFYGNPDAAKAAEYFQSGRFFWNAGIFLMKANILRGAPA
jgi:mannose-1-phosphate guanylyltransferase